VNIATAGRLVSATVCLVALASASATSVLAVGPTDTLGATVTANIYVDQSRDLNILNRSTISVLVTTEPSGGWQVEPSAPVVLGVGEKVTLQVAGSGADGADIAIRLRANDAPTDGRESAEIVLGARIYQQAPVTPDSSWIWLMVAAIVLGIGLAAVLIRRRPGGRPHPLAWLRHRHPQPSRG
jgi:hypothetical protein